MNIIGALLEVLAVGSIVALVGKLLFRYHELSVRPSLVSLILCVLCVVIVTRLMTSNNSSWIGKTVGYVMIVLVGGTWINTRHKADRRRAQFRRTARADEIAQALNSTGDHTPVFSLFLRPFLSTDRIATQGGLTAYPDHVDLESIMSRSLRRAAPLIALGTATDISEGAGRLHTTEAEWFQRFQELASVAKLVLAVPSAQPGTLREITFLAEQGLTSKVVFVMPEDVTRELPPNLRLSHEEHTIMGGFSTESDPELLKIEYHTAWAKAADASLECGIALPAYVSTGALFCLGPDGGVNRAAPLCLMLLRRRQRFVATALEYLLPLTALDPLDEDQLLDSFVACAQKDKRTKAVALREGGRLFSQWKNDGVSVKWMTRAGSIWQAE